MEDNISISCVERDTGISKDTLRIWERRYGFPNPGRDAQGERIYELVQVERLRLIKRMLDAGHRPGQVVAMPAAELARLSEAAAPMQGVGAARLPREFPELAAYLDLALAHDVAGLRRQMAQALARLGLQRFVIEVIAPLNTQIGDAWMRGLIGVAGEHLYTESVQVVLRNALHQLQSVAGARPEVLLATVSGEPHGLGLLMAEAALAVQGCRCVSLGVQIPVWDIALAAGAMGSDIVALSYSGCMNANQVVEGLTGLRAKLPERTQIWAGGSAPVLWRRAITGVLALSRLEDVAPALARWYAEHPSGDAPAAGPRS